MRMVRAVVFVAGACALTAGSARFPDQRSAENLEARRQAIFEAEDRRAPDAVALGILVDGTRSPDTRIQQMAVRALGRLERAALVRHIAPLVSAPVAAVRAEAVNALGQAISAPRPGAARAATAGGDQVEDATPTDAAALLLARLEIERDPGVRGVIGRTLGRLPYTDPAGAQRAEAALLAMAGDSGDPREGASLPALEGAAKGFEGLARRSVKLRALGAEAAARLRAMARTGRPTTSGASAAVESAARIRRLAVAALVASSQLDEDTVKAALADPDDEVRRLAVAGLGAVRDLSPERRLEHLSAGLVDAAAAVRYEALRAHGRGLPESGWKAVLAAVDDRSAHVALLAVDLLGHPTVAPEGVEVLTRLTGTWREAGSNDEGGSRDAEVSAPVRRTWHGPAHALAALAKAAPEAARDLLPAFAASRSWLVRMYAARAAGTLRDTDVLDRLVADPHDNVCDAALTALVAVSRHEADPQAIATLRRSDYQTVLGAARALRGSPNGADAVPALLATLDRITAEARDTSRDPRMALLDRIAEFGGPGAAQALLPYARDFDPRVADRAATIVASWTGTRPVVSPRPLPGDVPRLVDAERLRTALVRVTMAGGGVFELRLLPDEAPATVARFVRLARAGYYNGLTFHRVVPNFVIQGGSPGANEYVGDARYLRDELGLEPHTRGAVGISTRGRDAGDAQIFVDLVDLPRLDHDYTVFGRIVTGMAVVDRVLEGDVIERIEVR